VFISYSDDPFRSKLNSIMAGFLTVLSELFIVTTIAEQVFSHQPWTFHRVTNELCLVSAAFLVFVQWYVIRKAFNSLSKKLEAQETRTETGPAPSTALWAQLASVPAMSGMAVFAVTMAFRSLLDR
jgi:divalent metal cation (Fe/Co/Zn/Cd) transporter